MPARPYRFRITIGTLHVRVKVFERPQDMHAAVKSLHQIPCSSADRAVTVVFSPPEGGMLADLFLYWRSASRNTIAHEAGHIAWALALATKLGIGPDTEEDIFTSVGRLADAIHRGVERGQH